MTALGDLIAAEIAATGPISVARYMELCLGHPEHGYYITRDPLGRAGDFTTAPEISQMFGEALAIWVASAWAGMGRPAFRLVELGPGRGTLMADMLRVLERAGADPEPWLVETSPALRAAQRERVPHARWAESPSDIPEGPAIIVANEFLDALPVRQFLATPNGWSERQVGLSDGALVWGLSPPSGEATQDDWREHSPAADAILDWIGPRLDAAPGAALIVDYGYRGADRPAGPTLQAVRNHQRADPLERPGEADLTWLIDFDRVARALPGAHVAGQGAFLAAMGIGARAEALARARPDRAAEIAVQLDRLTAPDQMGTRFKVCQVLSPDLAPPPGLMIETP